MIYPQNQESETPPASLHIKSNPKGLDAVIQPIQRKLHKGLRELWGTPAQGETEAIPYDIQGYGRIYKTELRGETIGEAYSGGGEYGNIITADKSKFMFIENAEAIKKNTKFFETKIDICFILNLQEIKPNVAHRADSEVRSDVNQVLEAIGIRGNILSYKIGVSEVFGNIKFEYTDDMQPYHVFKFTIKIQYDLNATEC